MQNQRPMWEKISVWQYQQIYTVLNSKEKDATDLDLEVKLVGIVNNMTEMQIDSLPLDEYKQLSKTIAFLNEPIKGIPTKYIAISRSRRYRINYDISKMPFARYIESKVFSEDLYGNLHKLAATMVIPQKKMFFGYSGIWIDKKYDASKHQEYSNDMLEAKFVDVYHSLVFFYQVYRNWIEVSQDYLVSKLKEAGMKEDKAREVAANLCSILDGNIQPNLLPSTKIAQLRKYMK
jgi:hypothetical protein